ncbi:spermidine/putrescine ABC transporter permease [Rhizobium sp. Root149]|jgi:putative spermidine/putrescine transport system permease protein|uniref:ABC transporter permease n=1 Tax=Rhizobium TaxID=379 RepID=UPI000716271B|nr:MULTISPECIES: ABC transporter permease [Rhizobium]KQZ48978.1 spermidine/putrescine ABC transporter permease [Rhizobium sp. Root149]
MKRQRITPYLLLLPGLFPIVAFMSLVVGMAVSQSIGYFNFAGDDRFSLEFWEGMLSQSQFWRVFWYSARIAILSSLISVMLAYPVALWLRRPFPGSDLISAMIKAPLLVHGLVAAFLFVNFISFQGFLNVALVKLGLIDRPIRMQNDSYAIGVVILQVWKNMPLAFLVITGSVRSIGDDILDAARDLGAGSLARLRRVILPLTLRALQAALILIFIGAAGDWSFQVVAGPTNIQSMAQFMHRVQSDNAAHGWNEAAVVAVMLMALSLFGSLILAGLMQLLVRRVGR